MKTGLLVIDIQNDYFPGGAMELEGCAEAARRAAVLLDAFRGGGLPVWHVQHIACNPAATFFIPGTRGTDIHPDVQPLPAERVIVKHYPNSFRDTPLRELVVEEGISTLVICGMMSHMCVDATVRAAFDAGYACIVAHDACATRALAFDGVTVGAPEVHAAFMAALGAVYARMQRAEDVLAELFPSP